jgi:hypothetical protein
MQTDNRIKRMLRLIVRIFLIVFGMIFLGLSSLVLLSGKQINKNRLELADMRDRVAVVEKFELKNNRPPSKKEFQDLLVGLPVRYFAETYEFASTEAECPVNAPGGWPKTPGWTIYFWRGEWYEYYTSWNKHYTLEEQSTWWRFCGPFLFCPIAAALLLGSSFLPVFRPTRARANNAHPL